MHQQGNSHIVVILITLIYGIQDHQDFMIFSWSWSSSPQHHWHSTSLFISSPTISTARRTTVTLEYRVESFWQLFNSFDAIIRLQRRFNKPRATPRQTSHSEGPVEILRSLLRGVAFKEGLLVHSFPKYRHCLDGGGVWHMPGFFDGFVHMHWGP